MPNTVDIDLDALQARIAIALALNPEDVYVDLHQQDPASKPTENTDTEKTEKTETDSSSAQLEQEADPDDTPEGLSPGPKEAPALVVNIRRSLTPTPPSPASSNLPAASLASVLEGYGYRVYTDPTRPEPVGFLKFLRALLLFLAQAAGLAASIYLGQMGGYLLIAVFREELKYFAANTLPEERSLSLWIGVCAFLFTAGLYRTYLKVLTRILTKYYKSYPKNISTFTLPAHLRAKPFGKIRPWWQVLINPIITLIA